MIPDDEALMAYVDGELGPIMARRVEQALAGDPRLAARVAQEQALRARLTGAFAGIAAEPVPAALAGRLAANVVPMRRPVPKPRRWLEASAVAAALVLGIGVGRQWRAEPLEVAGDRLVAGGELAAALDGELSGGTGPARMLASFRATDGDYCRVFATRAADGIACRDAEGWAVRRTQSAAPAATAYRQAAAPAAALMAAAQDMMAGEPLDAAAERAARDRRWKP